MMSPETPAVPDRAPGVKEFLDRNEAKFAETLAAPTLLDTVVNRFQDPQNVPDWTLLFEEQDPRNAPIDPKEMARRFARSHMRNVLTQMAQEHPGIVVDPIIDETRGGYSFKKESDGSEVTVRNAKTNAEVTKYSLLAEIDGVLVAFEPSIEDPTGRRAMDNALRKARVDRRLEPLKAYAGAEGQIGYTVVTVKEADPPPADINPTKREVLEWRGGRFAAMQTSWTTFQEQAQYYLDHVRIPPAELLREQAGIEIGETEELRELKAALESESFDWHAIQPEVEPRLQAHEEPRRAGRVRAMPPRDAKEHIRGAIGESQVAHIVRKFIAARNDMQRLPIKSGEKSDHFNFQRTIGDGFNVYYRGSRDKITQVDIGAMVGGRPTFFEVKMAGPGEGSRRIMYGDITIEKMMQRFAAFQEKLGVNEFSYVLVLPSDDREFEEESTKNVLREFEKLGGTVVYLPITMNELDARADKYIATGSVVDSEPEPQT